LFVGMPPYILCLLEIHRHMWARVVPLLLCLCVSRAVGGFFRRARAARGARRTRQSVVSLSHPPGGNLRWLSGSAISVLPVLRQWGRLVPPSLRTCTGGATTLLSVFGSRRASKYYNIYLIGNNVFARPGFCCAQGIDGQDIRARAMRSFPLLFGS